MPTLALPLPPGLTALFAGLIAAVTSMALVPLAVRMAHRWNVFDHPNHRKDHAAPVPRLGGIAIAGGLAVGLLAAFLSGSFHAPDVNWFACCGVFVLGTAMVFAIGIADDVTEVSVRGKFAVQIIAALLVVGSGHTFTRISSPFGDPIELGIWGSVIAVLWIVGITNAVNLMDGLDGLAGGLSAIIAGSLMVFAAIVGEPSSMIVAACLAGAALGFLPANWNPARIYLGDSGSLTLGFVLACVSLTSSLKSSTALAVLVPILALGVPAIDTLLVMTVRFLDSPGHPILRRVGRMFEADRQHLHHLILATAVKRRKVVFSIYTLVAVFCLLAVGAAIMGNALMAMAVLFVEFVAIALIRETGIRAQARELTRQQREELKREMGIADEETPRALESLTES